MADRKLNAFPGMSRRMFCRSAIAAAILCAAKSSAQTSDAKPRVKFYKTLSPGPIGVKADQRQALDYAVKYGFAGIAPEYGEFEKASRDSVFKWVDEMKQKGIRYGSAGLPVQFRADEDAFKKDMALLPQRVQLLGRMGVTRIATWLSPGHNTLTYMQNFQQHKTRLRQVAAVLGDSGIRLGLEFVGPRTSRARSRFPFIATQAEMMDLIDAIEAKNVGLLLDSWHWYTSHGTVDELLRLTNDNIVHVHVNDAPAGVPVDQQVDNRRALPTTTGVIDLKSFINTLVKIGYDGPVECEPFDQELNQLENDAALQKTAESLTRLWALITP
jgi:sugar phosphate isomerase/epimerase